MERHAGYPATEEQPGSEGHETLSTRLELAVGRAGTIATGVYDAPAAWATAQAELDALAESFDRDAAGAPSATLARAFRRHAIDFKKRLAAARQEEIERKVATKRRVIDLVILAGQHRDLSARAPAVRALKGIWREIGPAGPATRQLSDEYAAAVKAFWDAEKASAAAAATTPRRRQWFWPFGRRP